MHPADIAISDYSYELPESRIAMYPLPHRDQSKLLIFNRGNISETVFAKIPEYLPPDGMLVYNDTRVINARIRFQKPTGGRIEIFCLEPVDKSRPGENTWHCLVGGASKWKEGTLSAECEIDGHAASLHARCLERRGEIFTIQFTWEPAHFSFEEVIRHAGSIPLPPYIKRNAEPEDAERYQTVYASHPGSVAAPTAGLHFTEKVLDDIRNRGIKSGHVTLHVSAGTFKPVDASTMKGHIMHAEWIEVSKGFIQSLMNHQGPVIAVGTTSVRTLETLYRLGVKAALDPDTRSLKLSQWEVYEEPQLSANMSKEESLKALLQWLDHQGQEKLVTSTEIMIAPGYQFRICHAIITNFHQPKSTLLLLVAAAAGNDWRKIYDYALENDFRFLSYGDSGLIFINQG